MRDIANRGRALKILAMVATCLAGLGLLAASQFASQPANADVTASQNEETRMAEYTKPEDAELRKNLTPLQFRVTQEEATEPAFQNPYWDNHEPGIYVDVVSGEPLFSSLDKFESGTGWPSFARPLVPGNIVEKSDRKLWMTRVEVRSRHADSHLGHVFDDGPAPTGQRYCLNSAALRFVPVDQLEEQGYSEFLPLFAAAGVALDDRARESASDRREVAVVAGGCFWGVEHLMRELDGVVETEVGYAGGTAPNPTYKQVCSGDTGHAEAVRVTFDPSVVTYEDVLRYFFRLHDPTTRNRQHNDVGTQYRSAIFYQSAEQRRIAERVTNEMDRSGEFKRPVVTEIAEAGEFWRAEEYHQDYLVKNPGGYMCHVLRD